MLSPPPKIYMFMVFDVPRWALAYIYMCGVEIPESWA